MKPFGSKRIHSKCCVYRAGFGKKILFTQHVKNRKRERQVSDCSDLV